MKSNTASGPKSSVTLPPKELALLHRLKRKLRATTNVEVVRMGLNLLEEQTERDALRESYARASAATRAGVSAELEELDHLTAEGLENE